MSSLQAIEVVVFFDSGSPLSGILPKAATKLQNILHMCKFSCIFFAIYLLFSDFICVCGKKVVLLYPELD
jgi:hypothetical protein